MTGRVVVVDWVVVGEAEGAEEVVGCGVVVPVVLTVPTEGGGYNGKLVSTVVLATDWVVDVTGEVIPVVSS